MEITSNRFSHLVFGQEKARRRKHYKSIGLSDNAIKAILDYEILMPRAAKRLTTENKHRFERFLGDWDGNPLT